VSHRARIDDVNHAGSASRYFSGRRGARRAERPPCAGAPRLVPGGLRQSWISCNVAPDGNSGIGTVGIISGNIGADYYGNAANRIVTCALRLPQGATITTTRTWGDDPRAGGSSILWYIMQTGYVAPDQTQTLLMAKSSQGSKTHWRGAPYSPISIDNENNAYVLQLYIIGGVYSITRLVEITNTMP
jgi:hypothetical protein